ncbi:MAG: beta strand repeat-containing protein, partial [bacterium]
NFSIKITARDANGNVATGFIGTVDLADNTGTLTPGAATITTGGTATVNVNITRAQPSVSITAKSGSLTGASNIFAVNPAALDHFLVTNTSNGAISAQQAGTSFSIKVVARDFFNNIVTTFNGTVALSNATTSINPATSGNFVNGVLASQSITITKTSAADAITVSGGAPVQTGVSNNFLVNAGNLAGFVLSNIPSPQTVGVPFPLIVTAVDANQNTVAGFTGTVNIQINSGNVTPGNSSNFVAGVWNGNVSVSASGNGKIITVSNGIFSTPSNAFNVNAGALDHFEIAAIGPQTAGVNFTVAVTAKDANNNNVSHTGTVTLSDITNTLTASPLVFSGQATQSATDVQIKKAQSGVIITASGSGKIGQSAPFLVNPGALHHFLVTNTSGSSIVSPQTAGVAFNIRVVAQDQFDNTATGFTQTVTITDLGTLNLTSANFVGGVLASQSVTINQARNDNQLTVTGGTPARSGTSNLFNVIAGGVASFTIDPVSDQATNEPFIITIRARDANGNLATGFGGTVTISDLTGTITPTTSLQFINGVRNESVRISQIRTGDVITVNSGGAPGSSNPFNVTAATVDHFVINTIGNQTAGQPFQV